MIFVYFFQYRSYHKAQGVNPDGIAYHVTFHLSLHCLPKYPFRVLQIQHVQLICAKVYKYSVDASIVFAKRTIHESKQTGSEDFEQTKHFSSGTRFPTISYVRPKKPQISLRIRAV